MLQRIHDTVGRWVALVLLGLVAAGFIFWGVNFGVTGSSTFAAKVNGESLPITEFDRELQARQNQYQSQYRVELTDEVRRELRRSVLEDMIAQAALRQRIESEGYRISNDRLTSFIRSAAPFQVDGKFDIDVYRGLLQNQGLTPTTFESLQRESLEVRELQNGIADSTFLTPAELRRYIELYNQRREVAYALFDVDALIPTVTVDEAAIKAHYEANKASYQTTESVDLEYLELSLADIAAKVEVTDDALRTLYDQEKERFQTPEARHARHILIDVKDGNEDAARMKAESVVERLKKGEDFAAVAKEVSDDAGTKNQGGDLGWISRGTLPGPFEDALFSMKAGEVKGPVRSDAGFHVIRLDEIREGTTQPFEEVRDDLASDYKTRQAEDKFYDRANQLEDKAFTAYNELTTVAAEMQLTLKTAKDFPRTGDPSIFQNSAPVVQAAFDDQTVDSGRNSKLVQLSEDHVLVLRVTAHHLPTDQPLDAVHDKIKQDLTRSRAQEVAEQDANAFLADVEKGADPAMAAAAHMGTWHAAGWVATYRRQGAERGAGTRVRAAEARQRRDARASRARQRQPRRACALEGGARGSRQPAANRARSAPQSARRSGRAGRAHLLRGQRSGSGQSANSARPCSSRTTETRASSIPLPARAFRRC